MKYFKKLAGEHVYLSPINMDDLETYTKWMNDYEVSGNLGNFSQTYSLASEKKTLEGMTSSGHNFAIVSQADDMLIGNISLEDVDHKNRKASIGLFIGDAENRNRGYGSEALRLMLEYAFKTLNLHNIILYVHADNDRAIACYKKVGFREFGRRREAFFKNGAFIDLVHMEILDTEYHAE